MTRIELAADSSAPRRARRLAAAVAGVPPARRADVELIVSELVTNAVVHAGLGEDDTIALELSKDGEALRIAVEDGGAFDGFAAAAGPARAGDGGLGLRLVAALCERWEARSGRVVAWVRLTG